MPLPGDRQHQLPCPRESLPELTQAEHMTLVQLARMTKAGSLRKFSVEHIEKSGDLAADWTEDGGGRLLK